MIGKPVKDGFYKSGQAKDIEMPPLGYQLGEPSMTQEDVQPQTQESSTIKVSESLPDGVESEFAQESEQTVQEVEVPSNDSSSEVQEQETKTSRFTKVKEDNFKALREAKEKAEKERDMLLEQYLKFSQQAKPSKDELPEVKKLPVYDDSDIDLGIDDDSLLEGKHAKKLVEHVKALRSELNQYKVQATQESLETKIVRQFPDFSSVVSQENIEVLNQEFPEVAMALRDTGDLYTKAAATYNMIKKMGLSSSNKGEFMADKNKALKNSVKPRPLTSVAPQQGDSPLSKANAFANGLTPELKEQLRKEMYNSRKGH